ncbi:MAG TPA: regulatory protein RecX [Burkholderiaceae bacterium]|nr:regulatory protein RecX [Burkholderiaceae bacterium]
MSVSPRGEPGAPRRARPRISLKMQAIGFLSRREHSRQELRAKLLASLRKRACEDAALTAAAEELARAALDQPSNGIDDAFAPPAPAIDADTDVDIEHIDPEAAVDQLLDWLVAHKYLSDARFVESRVNARSRKQGALRIKLELSRHGLALEADQAAALRDTEFARAQALWQRKFGEVAADPRQRAKQARFLAARGFAADVVRRLVGGRDED